MITLEEKRENFRRWWKGYIKIYPKEFILEHLEGIAETIFNSVLNCDIKIFDIDPWHYPSKGEYPTESGEYFVLIKGLNGSLRPHIFNYYADVKRWSFDVVPICWQYIIPPKEEA